MNPVTGDVMSEPAVESVTDAATREHRHWARPEPRVLHEAAHLRLEKSAEVRLRLQQGAPANRRPHFPRGVVRFVVLGVAGTRRLGEMLAVVAAEREYACSGDGP